MSKKELRIKNMTGKGYTVENALTDLAFYTFEVARKEAIMNTKITQLKEKFIEDTGEHVRKIKDLNKDIEAFCTANENEFTKKKSIEFASGIVGFRTTTPTVKQLTRKYTWEMILGLVQKVYPTRFIRTTPEINKETILKEFKAKQITDQELAVVGIRIDQDEKFYVDLKLERLGAQ